MASLLNLSLFFFFVGFAASASFLTDHVLDSQESTGRNLLQAKKGCEVNFEFMNYTVITSECKGPQYRPDLCCSAFKKFACPYADELNDLTSECANTMFSYINLYGRYPPGLFSSFCREGKEGLNCTNFLNETSSDTTASPGNIGQTLSLYAAAAASLVLLFQMF